MNGSEIESISKIKSDIIQDLLFKYVELLSKEYKTYFKISSDMCNDTEMYIFIDSKYNKNKIDMDNEIHVLYLNDMLEEFEWKCKEFIMKLDEKLSSEHLWFSENFHISHKDYETSKEFYDSCQLHFRIKELEAYYY